MRAFVALATAVLAISASATVRAQSESRTRCKLDEVQATLAVQGLEGWLLASAGQANPVAVDLANPSGATSELWFLLIPDQGPVAALAHSKDAASFAHLGDALVTYSSARSRAKALRKLLKGSKRVAMEYAPKSAIASLSRVSATTVKLVKTAGANVVSSASLVQFTKSLWGPDGRVAHYVAAHHLHVLIKQAMAHVQGELAAGRELTEYDLQQYIHRGYRVRGLVGDPPSIAAGANTAEPSYSPQESGAKVIGRGDLVRMTLWARLEEGPRPIFANLTWMAYAGSTVPKKYADAFAVAVSAREAALALIRDRVARRRAVKGYEPARAARELIGQAQMTGNLRHRVGHSLDTSVIGDGAHLDDGVAHDNRALARGGGFTVEPGLYFPGEFGVKTEVNVFLGRDGLEVTSPAQTEISPLLPSK